MHDDATAASACNVEPIQPLCGCNAKIFF